MTRIVFSRFRCHLLIAILVAIFATAGSCLPANAQSSVYVADASGPGYVWVINPATNAVTASVPVGSGGDPTGVAVTPNGALVYVTNSLTENVSVLNTATNAVTQILINDQSYGVAITPNGALAYVAGGANVYAIDTATNAIVGTVPVGGNGIAITPNGAFAYVSSVFSGNVAVIDTATNTVVATVSVGSFAAPGGGGVAITPNGAFAYVTESGNVSVINTATNTVVATVPAVAGAVGVAITPNGAFAYVSGATDVAVINTATNTVVTTVPYSPTIYSAGGGVAITSDGSFVYVTSYSGGNPPKSVSVINTATNAVVSTVTLGSYTNQPVAVAINPQVLAGPSSGTSCNGIYNGTFGGNITVSTGQNCTFIGGTITGNVTVTGGALVLTGVQVSGNVLIGGGGTFSIGPNTSMGSLDIQGDSPRGTTKNQVCGSTIRGDLHFRNNGDPVVIGSPNQSLCAGNVIHGNLEVQNNTGTTVIYGNTVRFDLLDQNNRAATVIDGNIVGWDLLAECNRVSTQVFSNSVKHDISCRDDARITGGRNTAERKQGQCSHF
jgi:YVTN family beta-propeller protein